MAEITPASGVENMRSVSKLLDMCSRVVGITLTSIDDADTLAIGPNALMLAFESTGAASTGEVGVSYDPATELATFDTAASDKSGTLYVFIGRSS